MHSFTTSASSLTVLSVLAFGSGTAAQLLGCDAVSCPVDEYRTPECKVGNATLKAIGIANVTTPLDTQPFTWTLGLEELNGTQQPTFDRNFYLGTPSSFKFNDTTGGCAFFFEGVSANLTTSKGNQLADFTCADALAEFCVSDLIAQAQSGFSNIDVARDESDFCNQLRDSLVNKPPSSCNGLQGTWGNIIAKPLSTNSTSSPFEQSQCHPTTGKNYNLSLVASIRNETSSRNVSALAPILSAITPVMTVFGKDNETEAQLSCLKLVDEQANQTVDTGTPPAQGAGAMLNIPAALFASVAGVAALLLR